jgi:hypothetical protein
MGHPEHPGFVGRQLPEGRDVEAETLTNPALRLFDLTIDTRWLQVDEAGGKVREHGLEGEAFLETRTLDRHTVSHSVILSRPGLQIQAARPAKNLPAGVTTAQYFTM